MGLLFGNTLKKKLESLGHKCDDEDWDKSAKKYRGEE